MKVFNPETKKSKSFTIYGVSVEEAYARLRFYAQTASIAKEGVVKIKVEGEKEQ